MKIKTGSDFSGAGAFDQSLNKLGIEQEKIFACDMDKHVRKVYVHNYGQPAYYPEDVYKREIPSDPLDIYMTSPPCQAFSMAGTRKGEGDDRGVLFYNSHEFIKVNRPRFFIFENVKGLLSADKGKTFNKWLDYLGGKSVNGNPVIFPHEEAVPYHIFHKVLNAKDFGVPQNRERVFIIGIRDDRDAGFSFPKPFPLNKKLIDIVEPEVEEKYFLSDRMITGLTKKNAQDNGFTFKPKDPEKSIGNCVTARCFKMGPDDNYIKVKPEAGRIVGRNPENPKLRRAGMITKQHLEINENSEITNTITTVQKDNVLITCDRIRRLTPRECFRLMGFPEDFDFSVVSDTQAYKQAGNSIVVDVLESIIKKLLKI